MRIGGLFSGIGGLELGLERAGVGHTVWQVEQDAWCRSVLAQHWPEAERFDDVCNVGAHNLSPVEVICGGFPCQDISKVGRGAGLDGARSGLFWELLRIVRELRPRFVVLENVAAIRTRGAAVVAHELAELGYDSVWGVVQAADVGAPHQRARWFCVAWVADPMRPGRQERDPASVPAGAVVAGGGGDPGGRTTAGPQPEPELGGGPDGLPPGLDRWPARPGEEQHTWEPPRTTARSAPNRNRRLKALGNAVVPAVAEVIGHWLLTVRDHMNDQYTRYLQAVQAGASTPEAIRTQARITERVRINAQRHHQARGNVQWAEGSGWTAAEPEPTRTCPRCGTTGPVSELFGWRTCAGRQRPQSYCRPCRGAKKP